MHQLHHFATSYNYSNNVLLMIKPLFSVCSGTDIVFVLDGSGEVQGTDSLHAVIEFLEDLLSLYNIAPDDVQVCTDQTQWILLLTSSVAKFIIA